MVAKKEHHLRTGCPIACALDIIGDHWNLLIIRNLMFLGRHEYKDMLAAEEGISSNILTSRLKKLEQAGLIASSPHAKSKRRKLYYLTDKGKGLLPAMLEISRWSDNYLSEWVLIPEEKRVLLDSPPQAVEEMVLRQLSEWEDQFITPA